MSEVSTKTVIKVVGGGASGLMLAEVLSARGHSVEIFEKAHRLGGLIQTLPLEYGLVETAANGFMNSEAVEKHFARIGLDLFPKASRRLNKYLFRDGMVRWPLKTREWPALVLGVARIASGLTPKRAMTVRDWGEKVFNTSITREILETVLQGVHGDNTQLLCAQAVLPLTRDKRLKKPKGPKGTVAPLNGMGSWIDCLHKALLSRGVKIHLNAEVDGQFIKDCLASGDRVVLATSAAVAARLLNEMKDSRGRFVQQMKMRSLVSHTIFLKSPSVKKTGFGILYPRSENFRVLGTLFTTDIFTERNNSTRSETFIFGEDALALTDDEILAESLKTRRARGETQNEILESVVTRWQHALPVMDLQWKMAMEQLEKDGDLRKIDNTRVSLFGNYLGDLGLGKILLRSEELADSL